jgi:hypothetical protein
MIEILERPSVGVPAMRSFRPRDDLRRCGVWRGSVTSARGVPSATAMAAAAPHKHVESEGACKGGSRGGRMPIHQVASPHPQPTPQPKFSIAWEASEGGRDAPCAALEVGDMFAGAL